MRESFIRSERTLSGMREPWRHALGWQVAFKVALGSVLGHTGHWISHIEPRPSRERGRETARARERERERERERVACARSTVEARFTTVTKLVTGTRFSLPVSLLKSTVCFRVFVFHVRPTAAGSDSAGFTDSSFGDPLSPGWPGRPRHGLMDIVS